jgi:hypothetical protein
VEHTEFEIKKLTIIKNMAFIATFMGTINAMFPL